MHWFDWARNFACCIKTNVYFNRFFWVQIAAHFWCYPFTIYINFISSTIKVSKLIEINHISPSFVMRKKFWKMKKVKNSSEIALQLLLLKNYCGVGELACFSLENVQFKRAMKVIIFFFANTIHDWNQNLINYFQINSLIKLKFI